MKKRSVLFLAAFAFLAFAIPAQAQTTLYIGAGASFPTSDFGDYANTGWMGTAGALFGAGPVGVGAEFFYGQNNHKDEVSLADDAKTTPWGFMGIVDYAFGQPDKIRPYVFGGLGVLIHKYSAGEISESETQFGYQAGAGLSFPLGIYVEGRYMGSEDTKYFGALAGFAFDL